MIRPRIALIHALRHSIDPIEAAFARYWPDASLMNLLDDSLSADLAAKGAIDAAMTDRFLGMARYAAACGSDAIQFTCSAFAPCIAACAADLSPLPVCGPAEAMIDAANRLPGRVGLLATFGPTLDTMPGEFGIDVKCALAVGALAALDAGDVAAHDAIVVRTAQKELRDCDLILLAQYSLARSAAAVAAATRKVVLTSPDTAVLALRKRLTGA